MSLDGSGVGTCGLYTRGVAVESESGSSTMGVLRGGVAFRSRLRTSLDEDALEPTGLRTLRVPKYHRVQGLSSSLDSPTGVDLDLSSEGGEIPDAMSDAPFTRGQAHVC